MAGSAQSMTHQQFVKPSNYMSIDDALASSEAARFVASLPTSRLSRGSAWSSSPVRDCVSEKQPGPAASSSSPAPSSGRVSSSAAVIAMSRLQVVLHSNELACAEASSCNHHFNYDPLETCRQSLHVDNAFIYANKAFELQTDITGASSGALPRSSDRCESLQVVCHRMATQPTAVHDNVAFTPTAATRGANVAASSPTVFCVDMVYGNDVFEAIAAADPLAATSETSSCGSRLGGRRGPCKRTEQQQLQQKQLQQRKARCVVSVVPERLRPRFSWSTVASRAKAVSPAA